MKKGTYYAPAIEVVEMDPEIQLLDGSVTGSASLGGLDDGGSLNDEW